MSGPLAQSVERGADVTLMKESILKVPTLSFFGNLGGL